MTNSRNWHDYPGTPARWKKEFAESYRRDWNTGYDENVVLRNDSPNPQTFTVWFGQPKDPEHPPAGWQRHHMSCRVTVPANGGELEVPRAWLAAVHRLDGNGRIVGGHAPALRVVQRSEDGREQDVTPELDGGLDLAMRPPSKPGKPHRRVRPLPEAPRE